MTEELTQICDRLRETEATNREQNARMLALSDRLTDHQSVIERSFKAMEEKDRRSDDRFNKFIQVIEDRNKKSDDHIDTLYKIVIYLVGAVIALALGPKTASAIWDSLHNTVPHQVAISCDVKPWDDTRFAPYINRSEDDITA